jgi:hypothetical protein
MATSRPVPFTPNANAGTNAPVRDVTNSARDDNTVQSQVAQAVRNSNSERIIPQDNVLSQYASYTYNVSIYIMSPDDYNNIVRTKRFKIPGAQLLMSSGGAPNTPDAGTGAPGGNTGITGTSQQTQANATAGRNQFFPLDFYLNDIRLTSLQPGKGTRSPHSNTTLNFKVIEPNGITFLDNLYAATQAYVGKQQNYGSQNFLMVIKFYGYDETGKMVLAQGLGTETGGTAIIEKWIPFQFTGIKFRIANKLTEYDCSAVCVPNNIATGQARGIIPYNLEIQAANLKGVLSGSATWKDPPSTTAAPPKAGSAPKPTITSGLVEALNLFQEELVGSNADAAKPPRFEIADQYAIEFTDPAIENASLLPPDGIGNAQKPTTQPTNSNQVVNGAAQTGSTDSKTVSAAAGTSIIQFLDQTIRTSRYIYDQQLVIFDADGQEIKQNVNPDQGVNWYRIGVKTEPIGYDRLRRDYAYKITYIVSPYRVNEIKGPYFPSSKFKGTHKKYLYWYTGLNTEILSYEQDFNYLYYIVINSGQTLPTTTLDFREEAKRASQTRSNESDQGNPGKVNDAGANAADQLYSPGDLARAKLSILGDPAWIHQNELWFGITEGAGSQEPFFPDGSINTEIQEPLFEVGFNKPADYNLQSGRMEVTNTNNGANRYTNVDGNGMASQSYIYRAVSVTSTFANGRFTQDLEGVLITFPRSAIKVNDAEVDSQFTEIKQETERILRDLDAANSTRAAINALAGGLSEEQASPSANSVPSQPSAPTTRPVSQNPAAPAATAPARPPTSSGQPVGTAAAATNTNAQSGGTRQITATDLSRGYTFSQQTFRQRDPAGARAYRDFQREKEKEISAAESARLTAQAQRNNNGTVSLRERELIDQQALITARRLSDRLAVEKFLPQIQAAGAITIPGATNPAAQQGAAVPRAPQTSSREP